IAAVELADEIEPVALAARDLVEILFHFGRELHVDQVTKVATQQSRDCKCGEARDERFPLPEDISPALDRTNRRRVGGRAANAEALELLDERRFGKPG